MSTKIERDYFIDSLRGLMLVIMALDHTPLFIKRYTYQTFGFFGAAIGFIFLSGYVFGFVYSGYLDRPNAMIKKTFKRVWLIYKYHIGLFLIVFLLNFLMSSVLHVGPLNHEIFTLYNSRASIIKFLFLLNQPGGFDILPLYIILLSVSPLALIGFQKGYAKLILISSFMLWLSIQIPNVQRSYENLQTYLNIDLGFFNIFAWQFLFFLGQYLGFNRHQGVRLVKYNHTRLGIAFSIIIILLIFRQIGFSLGWDFVLRMIDDRSYLMAPRLLNFLVMVYFIGGISMYLRITEINYLAFLGQHSIDVFVFHIPLMLLMLKGTAVLAGLNRPLQLILAFWLVISLAIPAITRAEIKIGCKKGRSQRLKFHLWRITSFPKEAHDYFIHATFNK